MFHCITGLTLAICLTTLVDSLLPANKKYDITKIESWPKANVTFGQLSAVAFDIDNNVLVLHRGHHVWDENTFLSNNSYAFIEQGPIHANVVVLLENYTGNYITSWGSNQFYMPHGLTVDADGNVWLTDVAMHQVFKFGPKGQMLLLSLGIKFQPGSDDKHFCKPTSVAVLSNGDFFIADGYCNHRIIKYSKSGTKLLEWGGNDDTGMPSANPTPYSLFVPHALAIISATQQVCVADREHGRIVCYHCTTGKYITQYKFPNSIGYRLFSLAYAPVDGGKFYVVNGPDYHQPPTYTVNAFIINIPNNTVEATFGDLKNPHDIAVNEIGSVVYVVEYIPSRLHKFEITRKNQLPTPVEKPSSVVVEKQITPEAETAAITTNSAGYVVLGFVITIVILLVVVLIYVIGLRRKDHRRYERVMEGDESTVSLFPQNGQD